MQQTAVNWIRHNNRTVCLVDWRRLAATEYTLAARKYTRMIGLYIAELIQSQNFDPNETIIVGHSLGAHIAGYCGAALNGTLKVIYGLDAAGPEFTHFEIVNVTKRLDSSDAQHVQCLHTNRGQLGTEFSCGDSDYYPNFGYRQPGCAMANIFCSHDRSYLLFEAAMDADRIFLAENCENDENYKRKRCTGTVDRFGIHGKHLSGQFYFKTSDCYPYCLTCAGENV